MPPDLLPSANGTPTQERKPAAHPLVEQLRPSIERLLWDVDEVAQALNVSARTVKRMAAGGELPAGVVVHLGRRRLFAVAALREWIGEGCPLPRRKPGGGRA